MLVYKSCMLKINGFKNTLHKLFAVLVFSNCFRAGFGAFSTFKFKVIEGTN